MRLRCRAVWSLARSMQCGAVCPASPLGGTHKTCVRTRLLLLLLRRSTAATLQLVVKESGVRGLWRGTGPTVWRLSVGVGINMLVLEKLKSVALQHMATAPGASLSSWQAAMVGGEAVGRPAGGQGERCIGAGAPRPAPAAAAVLVGRLAQAAAKTPPPPARLQACPGRCQPPSCHRSRWSRRAWNTPAPGACSTKSALLQAGWGRGCKPDAASGEVPGAAPHPASADACPACQCKHFSLLPLPLARALQHAARPDIRSAGGGRGRPVPRPGPHGAHQRTLLRFVLHGEASDQTD